MDLRIEHVDTPDGALLRVSGDLTGPRVAVLLDCCRAVEGAPVISIADLLEADETGIAALKYLHARGARIVDASGYFRCILLDA